MSETTPGTIIAIGCDHAAYDAKERIKAWLQMRGYSVEDFGTDSIESMDYPDVAHPLAEAVAAGNFSRGLLLCGSGLGMSYTANRTPGVRAALCWSAESASLARSHNNANVLVLPGRVETIDPLEDILLAWLETPFSGESRHERRIEKIEPKH